jgi:uncharacterized surface protein with fasciclin (FAS1) repeats
MLRYSLKLATALVFGIMFVAGNSFASSCASSTNKSSHAHSNTIVNASSDHATAKDIVTTAIEAGSFTTLVAAVKAAGLVETLQGPGPFTVFAPNDQAFAKIPKATLDALLADKSKLASVLTYHVVPGKVSAADAIALDGKEAATVNGQNIRIAAKKGVMINDANVVATDIHCSNGVIHVIDTVIMPK